MADFLLPGRTRVGQQGKGNLLDGVEYKGYINRKYFYGQSQNQGSPTSPLHITSYHSHMKNDSINNKVVISH